MEDVDVRVLAMRRLSVTRDDYHACVSMVLRLSAHPPTAKELFPLESPRMSSHGHSCRLRCMHHERTVVLVEIDTHFGGIVGVEWVMGGLFFCVRSLASEFRVRMLRILAAARAKDR